MNPFPFHLICAPDYEAMSRAAVTWLAERLQRKPDSLLVLATGTSPQRTYDLLAEQGRAQPALCDRLRILKLDEWGGLDMDDPATCEMTLRRTLADPLGIGSDRFHGWRSSPPDPEEECGRIAQWLALHGPADICVLGLGLNGHLGFNEPGDSVQPGPHRAALSNESKQHSMLSLARRQPQFGLTLGLRDILLSREILLLVSGEAKRSQLRRLLQPHVTPRFPASFLWLHREVTLCCDVAACGDGPAAQGDHPSDSP